MKDPPFLLAEIVVQSYISVAREKRNERFDVDPTYGRTRPCKEILGRRTDEPPSFCRNSELAVRHVEARKIRFPTRQNKDRLVLGEFVQKRS